MNVQTWVKWLAKINAITGGAVVELRKGPFYGICIRVSWMRGETPYTYERALTLYEMEKIPANRQHYILDRITQDLLNEMEKK